jgi:hypothetical protein
MMLDNIVRSDGPCRRVNLKLIQTVTIVADVRGYATIVGTSVVAGGCSLSFWRSRFLTFCLSSINWPCF